MEMKWSERGKNGVPTEDYMWNGGEEAHIVG
jgi:hypothetical protein